MPDPNPFPPNTPQPAAKASPETVTTGGSSGSTLLALFPVTEFHAKFIRPHEGRRLDVYADSLGIWTTGEGFNLEQPGAAEVCAKLGIDWAACMAEKGTGKKVITEEQCDALYVHVLTALLPEVQKAIPAFSSFSPARQMAIMDVAWAGIGTFRKFTKMLAAINDGDWAEAAKELLDSRLAVQWGHRAQEDARFLREG